MFHETVSVTGIPAGSSEDCNTDNNNCVTEAMCYSNVCSKWWSSEDNLTCLLYQTQQVVDGNVTCVQQWVFVFSLFIFYMCVCVCVCISPVDNEPLYQEYQRPVSMSVRSNNNTDNCVTWATCYTKVWSKWWSSEGNLNCRVCNS